MLLREKIAKDFTFHGLPCIWTGETYVLFDPSNLKMCAVVQPEELAKPDALKKLHHMGFVLDPKPASQDTNEKHVTFILTTDCNLGCPYCYTGSKDTAFILDPDVAIAILEAEVTPAQKLYLQFFGGEPTLNFGAIKRITEFTEIHYPNRFLFITTNGVISKTVLDYLIEHDLGFYLSLDGTREFHDRTRYTRVGSAGTYDRVIKTLMRLLDAKAPVKVRATISDFNVENMVDFATEMFDRGVSLIHFCPMTSIGRGASVKRTMSVEEFQDRFIMQLETVLDLARQRGARVITPATLAIGHPLVPYCKPVTADNKILITPEGKRTLCFGTQDEYHPIATFFITADYDPETGNLVPRSGAKDAIQRVYSQNLSACATCFARFMCEGGCLAENLAMTGKMTQFAQSWCQMQMMLWHTMIERIYKHSMGG